jgi:hypothetical protein
MNFFPVPYGHQLLLSVGLREVRSVAERILGRTDANDTGTGFWFRVAYAIESRKLHQQ